MKHKNIILPALSLIALALPTFLLAQGPPSAPPSRPRISRRTPPGSPAAPPSAAAAQPATDTFLLEQDGELVTFEFLGADLDTVMAQYCEWTDKIYLKIDAVTATISLKASKLTIPECVEVVDAILAMNNIALVPMGDKYLKVVQANAADLVGHGLDVSVDQDRKHTGSDKFITQIIQLKNVEIPEVQSAVQHVMHAYGKIMALTRSNSLMLTDTEANIKRAKELIDFIDQASARIEPRIYEIKYAEASEIASKLNEIVAMAQEAADQKKTPGTAAPRVPPGVIRARKGVPTKATPLPTQATIAQTEGGGAVMIQGTVKIMADERTNIIIIFSQEENFEFFDKIIKVLDVEVEPAITFEVVHLEYADAEELSGTLNDLVGAAQGNTSRGGSSSSRTGSQSRTGTSRPGSSRNNSSRNNSSRSNRSGSARLTPNAAPGASKASISNLNKLSENTKILADKRSNAILLMGEKADIAALKNVIASLDIMLEQVRIEAAIFEVQIGNGINHGIEWIYSTQNNDETAGWNTASSNNLSSAAAGLLTFYKNMTGINTELAIKAAATDSDARLLATPVILTTDNTEAKLNIGQQRPVVTSTDSFGNSSGTLRSSYEYKDIGIQLTVTPRINPQRVVVMEILQKADQVGRDIRIDDNPVPIILNREFEAQVSVPDRGTVALGGLIDSKVTDSVTKIPILGDIPFIGRFLFSSVKQEEERNELIVLLTPYVLTTNEELLEDTENLYKTTDMAPTDWPQEGWSQSKLRLIPDDKIDPLEGDYRHPQQDSRRKQYSESPSEHELEEFRNLLNNQ